MADDIVIPDEIPEMVPNEIIEGIPEFLLPPDIIFEVRRKMKPLYSRGFFLKPDFGLNPQFATLGGECQLFGAISPNSGRRLLQLASIQTTGGPLQCKDWDFPAIQLLYSWTCAICEGPFSYSFVGNAIAIVKYTHGDSYSDFPYEKYPASFDELSMSLVPVTDEEQMNIHKINAAAGQERFDLSTRFPELVIPQHQIGGTPFFLASKLTNSICPLCNNEMKFLGTIGDSTFSNPSSFSGNKFVQLVFEVCTDCSVVTVNNFSD